LPEINFGNNCAASAWLNGPPGLPPKEIKEMRFTIAIATHNRAHELRQTLASLVNVAKEGCEYEILVIANCCTDNTAAIVDEFRPEFGEKLRFVEEEKLGLGPARDRAVRESSSDIVAFLDDDVEVDAGWLKGLTSAFAAGEWAAVGGKTYLIYPTRRPDWLSPQLEGMLSKVDRGPERRTADPDELYGVNLSIRKEWLQKIGGIPLDWGRRGKRLFGGEDTEALRRIHKAGGILLYEPTAVVGHRVDPERLSFRWFWRRAFWGTFGDAWLLGLEVIGTYPLARLLWYLLRDSLGMTKALVREGKSGQNFLVKSIKLAAHLGICFGAAHGFLARLSTRAWKRAVHPHSELGAAKS
jgi:glycosyltransferase involved in cell wall biosynthesis